MKFLTMYLFCFIVKFGFISSQTASKFPLFGYSNIYPGTLYYINITSLDIGSEIILEFSISYDIDYEISVNKMRGYFGYSNNLPTFDEFFFGNSVAGY